MSNTRVSRVRIVGWIALLCLYPFGLIFPLFLGLEGVYRGVADREGRLFEIAAGDIDESRHYHCKPVKGSKDGQQGRVFYDVTRGTLIGSPLKIASYDVQNWVYRRSLPLFRDAFGITDVNSGWRDVGSDFSTRADKHCREQAFLTRIGKPTEPLDIYPEFKRALLDTQKKLDAAIAGYESTRPLFLALMWGWAVFELVGCYLGLKLIRGDIRRWRALKAANAPGPKADRDEHND